MIAGFTNSPIRETIFGDPEKKYDGERRVIHSTRLPSRLPSPSPGARSDGAPTWSGRARHAAHCPPRQRHRSRGEPRPRPYILGKGIRALGAAAAAAGIASSMAASLRSLARSEWEMGAGKKEVRSCTTCTLHDSNVGRALGEAGA